MGKAVGEEEPLAGGEQWGGEPRPPPGWETEHPHPAAEEQLPLEGADRAGSRWLLCARRASWVPRTALGPAEAASTHREFTDTHSGKPGLGT